MPITFDSGVHLFEVIAIVFWIGVSWGDVKWIKSEVKHLRELIESTLLKGKTSS